MIINYTTTALPTMSISPEFALIHRHFAGCAPPNFLALGIGDDAALLPWPVADAQRRGNPPPAGQKAALAITTDTLVAGVHFFADGDPAALGWKALAVNLSDLAAMGARPVAFLLALTIPKADEQWLRPFVEGLAQCARAYEVALVGGDTTRGPLAITITALGEVPWGEAARRSGAQVGDDLWVSGQPGRAGLGLAIRKGQLADSLSGAVEWLAALDRPIPRVALGLALRTVAHAMLDLSDGLTQDACHLVEERPELAVVLKEEWLPLAPLLDGGAPLALARTALLAGGDDYELLFTAPATARAAVLTASKTSATPVHRIGSIEPRSEGEPLMLKTTAGAMTPLTPRGWDPFREES
jgi:thiamine-monophosphate kinase